MKPLNALVRPNIQNLLRADQPAPDAAAPVDLAHQESPFNAPLNRFTTDAEYAALTAAFAREKHVDAGQIVFSIGQTSPVDNLLRVFCTPKRDNVILHEPSPRSYKRVAVLNEVEYRSCPLVPAFQLNVDAMLAAANHQTKLMLLCSPNVPTGQLLDRECILSLADRFDGLVVVDETFVEFSRSKSLVEEISAHPNIVVVGMLSAAHSLAALSLGYVIAAAPIAAVLRQLQPAASLPRPVVDAAVEMLTRNRFDIDKWVQWTLEERTKVMVAVRSLPLCRELYPSAANFFMFRVDNAAALVAYLRAEGVNVADCTPYPGCTNCLSATVGLTNDNNALLGALRRYGI